MAQRQELIASLAADSGMENPFLQTRSSSKKTTPTHLKKKKKKKTNEKVIIEGVEDEVEEEEKKKRKEATIASTNASVIAVLSEKLQYVQSLQRRGPSAKDLQLLSQSLDPAEVARWEEDRKQKGKQARNKSIEVLSTYVFSEYKRVNDTIPAALSSSSSTTSASASASSASYYSPLSPPQMEIEVRLGQLSSDSSQFISGVHESTFDALMFALEQQMAATSSSKDPLKVVVRRSTDHIKTLKTNNEDKMVRQKLRISCHSDSSAPQGRGNRWLAEDEHDKKKGKGRKRNVNVNETAKGKRPGNGQKLQDIDSESESESESENEQEEEEEKGEPTAALKSLWSLRNVPLTTCHLSFDCRLTVSTEQEVVLPVASSSSSSSSSSSTPSTSSSASSNLQRYKRRWTFSKKSEDILLDLTIVASLKQSEGSRYRSHNQQPTVSNTQFTYEVEMEVKPESLSKFSTLEGSRHVISQMFDKMQELNECLKFTRTLPSFSSISLAASLTSAKQARVAALFKSLIAGKMKKLNEDDAKSLPTGLLSPGTSALPFGRRHFAKIAKEKRDKIWVCEQSTLVESNNNAASQIPAVVYYLLAVPFEAKKKEEGISSSASQNRPPTSSISIIDPFDDIGGLYLIDPVRLSIFSVKGMDSVMGALASSGPTILEGDLIQGRGDKHTVVPPPIFQIFDILVSDGFTGISEENFEVRLKEIRALVHRYSALPGLSSRSQPFLIASKAFYPITDFSLMCSNHLSLDSKSVFWFIRRGGTDAGGGGGIALEGKDPASVPFLKVASSHRLDGFLFVFSSYQRRSREGVASTANTSLLSYNFSDRTTLNLRASQSATGTKKVVRLSCVTLDPLTKKEIEVPVEDMVELSDSDKKRLGRDLEQLVGAAGKEAGEEGKQKRKSPSSFQKDVEMGEAREQEEEGESLSSSSVISGVVKCTYSLWDGAWKYLSLSGDRTSPLTSQQTFRTLLAIAEDVTVNELIARLTPPPPQAEPRHNRGGGSFATPSASSSTSALSTAASSSLAEAFSAALACASSGLSSSSSDTISGATNRKRNWNGGSGRKDKQTEMNVVLKRQKQEPGALVVGKKKRKRKR